MKKPTSNDLLRAAKALRTKHRIWAERGGDAPAQAFLRGAEVLELEAKKLTKGG